MKIERVYFPTPLTMIEDCTDDNIDVIVRLEDGKDYVLVIATPKNLVSLMKKECKCYLDAGTPFAIVEELTEKNVLDLIDSFCKDDAYWLKYYHEAGEKQED